MTQLLTQEKFFNSEVFKDQIIPAHLSHLPELQCSDLVELIKLNRMLFADVLSQTQMLKHDIDVGSFKQHPYQLCLDKLCLMKQVKYMVQHGYCA